MFREKQNIGFIISVISVLLATLCICISIISCSGSKLTFESSYYFVCYRIADNSVSASSLSGTVSSYGGAGYILYYDGNYYITVSCYYDYNDADTVCTSLKRRDLECSVLTVNIEKFKLQNNAAKRNAELYKGNLNTLHSLSILAYECANGLDTGLYNQNKAIEVLDAINTGLKGLLKSNNANCFTHNLENLIAECDDKAKNYIYSKDVRYLQISIIDCIINANLT